jgi:hypothetical protein
MIKSVTPFDNKVDVNPSAKNFATSQNDFAVFLPSISSIYTKIVSMDKYDLRGQMPAGLPNGREDLNFLNPTSHLFYYPMALYSAGHAVLDPTTAYESEKMVHQRDKKNTVIVGDSGGFQVSTGVLKWPGWFDKKGQTGPELAKSRDDFRMKLLRWLEFTSDYAMTLDFPTSSLFKFGNDPVTDENLHPGLKSFRDCLNGTLENHAFFIKNRVEGATRFMNVLQCRNQEEGDIWYDEVKDLPFEDWAMAGSYRYDMGLSIRRLLIMRDEHYLDNRKLIHFLGNGKLKASCVFTTLQRALRKDFKDLTLSYDAASPFVMVAMGHQYLGYELSHGQMSFKNSDIVDRKELKNDKTLLNDWIESQAAEKNKGYVYRSVIGDRLTVGDICYKGYEDIKFKKKAFTKGELETEIYKNSMEAIYEDKFRWTKAYKDWMIHSKENGGLFDFSESFKDEEKYQGKWPSSLDGLSYVLAMNHNVEMHINAMQAANYFQDQPLHIASQHVTSDVLEFKDLCPEIFKSECPMDLIAKHRTLLQNATGMGPEADLTIDMDFSIDDK